MYLKDNGFTLLEVMFSIGLLAILLMGIITTIIAFSTYTKRDFIQMCLLEAASSGIEAKKANYSLNQLDVNCGGIVVNVTVTGNPPSQPPMPGSNVTACEIVTATSSYSGRSLTMRDRICNFSR
ncbi:MAG: type II secretion system protein [Candidatus Methanomethylicaceae archaeon]